MRKYWLGKRGNAGGKHFLLLPQCFLPSQTLIFILMFKIHIFVCECFQFGPVKNFWKRFTSAHICNKSLLKTLWKKEKLLKTSNFPFSHSVFYLFGELSAISIQFKIAFCKLFQFGRVQILLFGKGLTLYHTKKTLTPKGKSLLETVSEKEKILVTSMFDLFHNVLYPVKGKFDI